MSQKVLSFFLAFALVLSLTRIVFLTDVRAEEIAEARNDVVASPSQAENSLPPIEPAAESPDELHPVDDLTESDSIDRDKWLEIMREQEELMTPEIRASIRENVKAGLKKQLEERFGSVEAALNTTVSASELGFASEDELQMWQDTVRDVFQPNASSNNFTLNHTEYAVRQGSFFELVVSGYNNVNNINWTTMNGTKYVTHRPSPHGNHVRFVDGNAIGTEYVIANETNWNSGVACCTEIISFTTNYTSKTIAVGESFTVTATTSYSNSNVAIRALNNIGGMVSFSGATVSGVTPGTAELIVYLVDRPTVCKALTVTVTEAAPTIDFTIPSGDHYAYENITLTPITTPANAEVEWSVAPDGGGVFNGNVFTPYRAGAGVIIYAKIKGTNIKKSRLMYVNKRIISVEPINDTYTTGNGFYVNATISHGNVGDITYSSSNPSVVHHSAIISYYLCEAPGDATLILSAPGPDDVSIDVHVTPQCLFSSPPATLYEGSTYQFTVYSDTPASVEADATFRAPEGYEDSIELTVERNGNYHTFTYVAGAAGLQVTISALELYDYSICSRTYTIAAPVVNREIRRVTSQETVVYNEDTTGNNEIVVNLQSQMLINGTPQSINSGISYSVYSSDEGLNYTLNGGTLIITPTKMPAMSNRNGYDYAAHYVGEIIIRAYLTSQPSVYTTYNVEVKCHNISPSGVNNIGKYISIPFSDISGSAKSGLFAEALSTVQMSASTSGGNITGASGCSPQMEFFELVRGANVVAIHSHGEPGFLPINTTNTAHANNITVADIEQLHDGYFLSTNLILMLSCHAGEGIGSSVLSPSLLSAFCSKGAQSGIGYSNSVRTAAAAAFETEFYNQIKLNGNQKTISELYSDAHNNCTEDACYGLSFTGSPTSRLND